MFAILAMVLSVAAGQPVVGSEAPAPSVGTPASASDPPPGSPPPATPGVAASGAEAVESYRAQRVLIEDVPGQERPTVRRGSDGTVLTGPELYEALNRRDLASSYRTRAAIRPVLRYGAPVVALVGILGTVYAYQRLDCGTSVTSSQAESCNLTPQRAAWIALGAVVVVASGYAFYLSFAMSPDPVDAAELRALVHEHDARLRARLGIPPDASGSGPDPGGPLSFGLTPTAGGLAVSIGGRF